MNRIYFDNGATTMVDPEILDSMRPYFLENYGNASSIHTFGGEASETIENARKQLADGLGAKDREIYFTSGGTESDNIAIQGYAFANMEKGTNIITSRIEHAAVLNTCKYLEGQGFSVTYLPVDKEGLVSPDELAQAMRKDTILVSIMAANSEIGTIEPFRELGKIAREGGAAFHTDAVQYVTKHPLNVNTDNIDMLSLASHKFHGPKGVGALFVRKGLRVRPVVYGGGQERGLRSSTENVPGIFGMVEAFKKATTNMERNAEKMQAIRDHMIDNIVPSTEDCYLNGPRRKRLCNNVHIRFDYIEGESLALMLDAKGIAISTGSACSSKSLEPSHVLMALGLKAEQTHGSMRVSLSRFSTKEEADYLLETLPGVVKKLQEMSPTYMEAKK